jgi:hypothetical protein
MDARLALYYMCSVAGVVMIVGGIWLIYKQKIYIDRESKQPVEINTPLGNFKSNYPALTLFALGFVPLIYPIYSLNTLVGYVKVDTVRIRGPVETSAYPALVYAARAQDSLTKNGEFRVPVPYIGNDDYRLLLVVNGRVFDEARVPDRVKPGEDIRVEFRPITVEQSAFEPQINSVPEIYR